MIFNSIPGGRQGYSDSVKVTMRRDGAFQEMVYVVIAIATLIVSAILVWRIKRWYDRRKRQAQKKIESHAREAPKKIIFVKEMRTRHFDVDSDVQQERHSKPFETHHPPTFHAKPLPTLTADALRRLDELSNGEKFTSLNALKPLPPISAPSLPKQDNSLSIKSSFQNSHGGPELLEIYRKKQMSRSKYVLPPLDESFDALIYDRQKRSTSVADLSTKAYIGTLSIPPPPLNRVRPTNTRAWENRQKLNKTMLALHGDRRQGVEEESSIKRWSVRPPPGAPPISGEDEVGTALENHERNSRSFFDGGSSPGSRVLRKYQQ